MILTITVSGCATTGYTPNDTVQGTAGGTLIGGGLGAAIAAITGQDPAMGALIGAGAGAVLGTIVGTEAAEKRKAYAKDHGTIEDVISQIDNEINNIKTEVALIENKLKERTAEIQQLTQKKQLQTAEINKGKTLLAQLSNDIDKNNTLKVKTQTEIDNIKIKIASIDTVPTDDKQKINAEELKRDLVQRRETLIVSLYNINGISQDLSSQKNTLSSLIPG